MTPRSATWAEAMWRQRIGDADRSVVVEIGAHEGPVHMFERMGEPTTTQ
jgi:hypothetical protein